MLMSEEDKIYSAEISYELCKHLRDALAEKIHELCKRNKKGISHYMIIQSVSLILGYVFRKAQDDSVLNLSDDDALKQLMSISNAVTEQAFNNLFAKGSSKSEDKFEKYINSVIGGGENVH